MTSPAARPLAKDAESTPLDILLNAITGTRDAYPYPDQTQQNSGFVNPDTLDAAETSGSATMLKRKRGDDPDVDSQSDIAKLISSWFPTNHEPFPDGNVGATDSVSSIQLWHPRTAQKGYGKEKRLLNPPPSLRITGPIRDLLTDVTLSAIPVAKLTETTTARSSSFSAQTHHIPLLPPNPAAEDTSEMSLFPMDKKAQREAKRRKIREEAGKHGFGSSLPWIRQKTTIRERQVLSDGLTFPGLWVGEEIGKDKEFQLELKISQTSPREADRPREDVQSLIDPILDDTLEAGQTDVMTPSMGAITAEDLEQIGESAMAGFAGSSQQHDGSDQIQDSPSLVPDFPDVTSTAQARDTWGKFLSGSLTVISKPSQKTARARSKASCMTVQDNFALSVRINSQTVRTRYMKLEDKVPPRLASRTGSWTPFRFDILHRPPIPKPGANTTIDPNSSDFVGDGDVLTYGSVVSIVDCNSGYRSDPVKIVHVDRNEVIHGLDEGHPVSELHRVGFVQWDQQDDASSKEAQYRRPRFYLSAPGARVGGGELLGHRYVPVKPKTDKKGSASPATPVLHDRTAPTTLEEAADRVAGTTLEQVEQVEEPVLLKKKQRRTNRIALAKATLDEEDENSPTSALSWHQAEGEEKQTAVTMKKNQTETRWEYVERVEDWMCWTITGVDCLSYAFVDQKSRASASLSGSIGVVPRLLAEPIIERTSDTLDLLVQPSSSSDPLDVYIGSYGPLANTVWSSTAPRTGHKSNGSHAAICIDDSTESKAIARRRYVACSYPSDRPHSLLIVELSDVRNLLGEKDRFRSNTQVPAMDTLQSRDSLSRQGQTPPGLEDDQPAPILPLDPDEMDDSPWLAEHEHDHVDSGELTIQEALRNAEVALHHDLALSTLSADGLTSSDFAMNIQGIEHIDHAIPLDEMNQSGLEHQPREEVDVDGYRRTVSGNGNNQALEMHSPPEQGDSSGVDHLLLPIILVRRSVGVIFATGWNIAVMRDERDGSSLTVVADKRSPTA